MAPKPQKTFKKDDRRRGVGEGGSSTCSSEEVARIALELDPKARRQGEDWMLRCPAHDDRNPSLSMTRRDARLLVHCHAGCSQAAVVEAIKFRGLWPGACLEDASSAGQKAPVGAQVVRERLRMIAEKRTKLARSLFANASTLRKTAALRYLSETRGIGDAVIGCLGDEVRFVGRLNAPQDVDDDSDYCGLVAALRGPGGEVRAIQRQWLTDDGQKAPFANSKRFLGGPRGAGCYVGCRPGAAIVGKILVAEGLETLLSAMQLQGLRQGIAAFTADNLSKLELPPPDSAFSATIVIAYDVGDVGEKAGMVLRRRLLEQGHDVELLAPPEVDLTGDGKPSDWNDVLIGKAPPDACPASDATHPSDWFPPGFRKGENGWIERAEETPHGDTLWRPVCSPITVLALTHNGVGREWGYHLEITDPDGRLHRWTAPAELFADDGATAAKALSSFGLKIKPGRRARSALVELLMSCRIEGRATTTPRLGWIGGGRNSFVLGDGRVLGNERVAFQNHHRSTLAAEMRSNGEAEAWKEQVSTLAVGNPLLSFAVSCAFAGSLLEPLGADGGGFHLFGQSSRGKTSALRLAASVWGSPRFVGSWRATANGVEGAATATNGTILILDELAEAPPHEASQVAYMLANGRGKERMTASAVPRATATWKTLVLSSGEITLANKLLECGRHRKAGEAVRMIDIPATDRAFGAFDVLHGQESGAAFAELVASVAAEHFGHAGPAFVARIVDQFDQERRRARTLVKEAVDQAKKALDLCGRQDGQIERALKRFAIVAAAGEMATGFGLLRWPEGEATRAAVETAGLWLETRGGVVSGELDEAVSRVREFIARHGSARFELMQPTGGPAVLNRAGWWDPDAELFFVARDVWFSEIFAAMDGKRAARLLCDANLLEPGDGVNLMRRLPRSVTGRPRAYAVRAEILGRDGNGMAA